ncbi:MAG: GntR family transcriptional regulator [Chloroflexota bacterium]
MLVRSSVPLYAQLEAALRESIRRGMWGPGDPLPSDRDMAEQWQVSRCTVRQALDNLARDGLIERRQGKGTFVVPTAPLRDFIGYYSFIGAEGEPVRLTTKVLSFESVQAQPEACERLRVMPGIEVMRLRLLRLANQTPALLLTSYLPSEACSGLQPEDFLAFPVLTEVIANRCGIPVVSQTRTIRAMHISGDDAAVLEVEPGSLGLRMERVSFTDHRQPVEYGLTMVRADLVSYTLDIARPGGPVGRGTHKGASPQASVAPRS